MPGAATQRNDRFGSNPDSLLGGARPLLPSADMARPGQSVGQDAQFCLGSGDDSMSRESMDRMARRAPEREASRPSMRAGFSASLLDLFVIGLDLRAGRPNCSRRARASRAS